MSSPVTTAASGTRIVLAIEYDGTAFSGWQKQSSPELPTVQGALESALSQVANAPIATVCAGRTDAGVHAGCQVVHFDTPVDRGVRAWTRGINSLLPAAVRVLWAQPVDTDFHARFSAQARRYQYLLYTRGTASALLAGRVTHWPHALDVQAMNEAASALTGEQDFSVFRAAGCQSKSSLRNVHHAGFSRQGPFLVFEIQANAFLQHMVRNIVGSLLRVGAGEAAPGWISELLAAGDRRLAAATAPPEGLYLAGVSYPDTFALLSTLQPPPFLASLAVAQES